jgi:hypothetical protein
MHAQRCGFSLGKVSQKIVANIQKDRFLKKGFRKQIFLRKSFEIFWKIMEISSKGFCLKKCTMGFLPEVF